MARQTEVVLLLILTIAATAFAELEKPLPAEVEKPLPDALNNKKWGTCPGCCPFGWVKFNGRCFSYHSIKMDWASAENHCLKLGSNLMSVHNNNEYQLAKALIRAYDPVEPPTWLGLSNCQKRYNWFWSDGTKVTFTKWNSAEPNFHNQECCVHMNWGGQKDWNDIPCEQTYPFVCAKKIN